MNREEKNITLDAYRELFDGVEAVVLADVSKVNVNTINSIRSKFRADGVTFRVVKNTIARLAMQGTEFEALRDSITGPTAIALKKGDPVTPAKICIDFVKECPKFVIKAGYVNGSILDAKGVETLSKMKGQDELRAELLSIFKAPQTQFVGVANTMVTQILGLLNARKSKIEEAG